MLLENDVFKTTTQDGKWVHVRASDFSNEIIKLNILYIGLDENALQGACSTERWFSTKNLEEAKLFISHVSSTNRKLPDTLLVDVAYDEQLFTEFISFLKEEALLSRILIFMNSKHLKASQINTLKRKTFIDDLIDFDLKNIDYLGKIHFIKKAKREERKLFKARKSNFQWKNFRNHITLCAKRIIDVVVSGMLSILLLPVFIVIAIAIKLESAGPVFYTAKRVGRGFKVFDFFKFRTMVADADKKINSLSHLNQYGTEVNGPRFIKISNDPRVTKLGRFLRNTSLDELPQLFNVFIGDMSLVGNRPLPVYEAVSLTTNDFVERFSAPAGITGLWQIKKRGKSDMSSEERINLDIEYARTYSVLVDFQIAVRTPRALFQKTDV